MTTDPLTETERAALDALDALGNTLMYVGTSDRARLKAARAVVAAVRPQIEAQALREFADSNRFPSNWAMFRRNDGTGVTVPDLLREVAAGKLARQSLSRPTSEETHE